MSIPKISKVHGAVLDRKAARTADAILSGGSIPANIKKRGMKDNSLWDDVEKHYILANKAMAKVDGTLLEAIEDTLSDPAKVARIKDSQELVVLVGTLTRDLEAHVDRLNKIHEQHAGKSGGVGIEELSEVLKMHTQYQEAAEIYDGNIVPLHTQILQILGGVDEVADIVIQDQQAQAELSEITPVVEG